MKYFNNNENDYINALHTIANHESTNLIEAIMQVNAFTLLDTMAYIGVEATIDNEVVYDERVTKEELLEIIQTIRANGTGKSSKILAINLITGEILHEQTYDTTCGGTSFGLYVADTLLEE